MNKALIVFLKVPELGKAKTRLAASIGNEKALKVYKLLLEIIADLLSSLNADISVFCFYSGNSANLPESFNAFRLQEQVGEDLGERMKNAFEVVFKEGFQHIAIIGTDCPAISKAQIENALSVQLDSADFVIGPANDGGYYLLAMKYVEKSLFDSMKWSTNQVYNETISRINDLNKSYKALEILVDIDTLEDLELYPEIYSSIV